RTFFKAAAPAPIYPLSLTRRSSDLIGSVRAVDPRQRVRFVEPGQPVPGLRTQSGRPILSESLLVEFPPTQSRAVETWFLTIGAYDRKSTRLNSSHVSISYAVCCLNT